MTARAAKRWRGWVLYGVALVAVAVLAVYVVADRFPKVAVESLEKSLAEAGIAFKADRPVFGWKGGQTGTLRARSTAVDLTAEDAVATWSFGSVIRGRIDDLALHGVEAEVDVAAIWPDSPAPRGEGMLTPLQPAPAESTLMSEWDSEPLSAEPTALAGSEVPVDAPVFVERPDDPVSDSSGDPVGWWEELPFNSLWLSDALVHAVRDEAVWPLRVSLGYAVEDLKREARLQVLSEGLDLRLSARELSEAAGWSAQGTLLWEDPVARLKQFFPPGYLICFDALSERGLRALELDRLRAEGVIRGEQAQWEDLGILLEGETARIEWHGGEAALTEWIVAARGSPGSIEVNGGMSVAHWHQGDWSASHFQVSVGREATGLVVVETPRMEWAHAAGWSGVVTARQFSRWPVPNPADQQMEAQLAFTRLVGPGLSLAPFRLFINQSGSEWDARISTLATAVFPEWAVTGTHIRAQLDSHATAEIQVDMALEHVPNANTVVHLTGSLRPEAEGVHGVGSLRLPDDSVLATWSAEHRRDQASRLQLAEDWDLARVIPWLADTLPGARGWKGAGRVEWTLDVETPREARIPFRARLEADWQQAVLQSPTGWSARGIDGTLRLEAVPFLRARGLQALSIDQLSIEAFLLENVGIRFTWPMQNRLQVEQVNGNWRGGTFETAPFHFDPVAPAVDVRVCLAGADPAAVAAVFGLDPGAAAGRLDGDLQVRFTGGRWTRITGEWRSADRSWPVSLDRTSEGIGQKAE